MKNKKFKSILFAGLALFALSSCALGELPSGGFGGDPFQPSVGPSSEIPSYDNSSSEYPSSSEPSSEEPSSVYPSENNPYYEIYDDYTYPWIHVGNGEYVSSNQGIHDSVSQMRLIASENIQLSIDYTVISETNFDYLVIYLNDSVLLSDKSGSVSSTITVELSYGDYLDFYYIKDSVASSGADEARVILEATPNNESTIDYYNYYTVECYGDYPFVLNYGAYYSTNYNISSSSSNMRLTATADIELEMEYQVSSEPSYDVFRGVLNGYTTIFSNSGEYSSYLSVVLNEGDYIEFVYSKDSSGNNGQDMAVIMFYASLYNEPSSSEPSSEEPSSSEPSSSEPSSEYPSENNPYYEIYDDYTYPWIHVGNGEYVSSNQGRDNTTSEMRLIANENIELSIGYTVSSESSYDYLVIYLNNSVLLSNKSGSVSSTITVELSYGDYLDFYYIKDGSRSSGDDEARVTLEATRNGVVEDNEHYELYRNYSYVWQLQYDGGYNSSIQGIHNTIAQMDVEANVNITLTIDYTVSSESGCDHFYILDSDGYYVLNRQSGNKSGTITVSLSAGDYISLMYSKDISVSSGDDCAIVYLSSTTTSSGGGGQTSQYTTESVIQDITRNLFGGTPQLGADYELYPDTDDAYYALVNFGSYSSSMSLFKQGVEIVEQYLPSYLVRVTQIEESELADGSPCAQSIFYTDDATIGVVILCFYYNGLIVAEVGVLYI